MKATIVQHSFNKYEVTERNGTVEEKILVESSKEYQLKFHGKEYVKIGLMYEFNKWIHTIGGKYDFDIDNCKNMHSHPDGFDCWCEVFEYYLINIEQYNKKHISSKFFAFEKIHN